MDMVARTTAFYLPKYLKEASKGAKGGDVVVENRSEAGGEEPTALSTRPGRMAIRSATSILLLSLKNYSPNWILRLKNILILQDSEPLTVS